MSKNLCIQEIVVKKPLEFKVWPVLTRGVVNYESDKTVTIYDPTGSVLIKAGKGRGKFPLKDVGIYFLKSGSDVKKVVWIK